MTQEKVTRQELRELHVGQTRIFVLNERKKIKSALVTCDYLKHAEDLVFMAKPDWAASAVSITRMK
jgi:hypothetical protein